MPVVLYWVLRRYTRERYGVKSNLKASPAESCFDGSPGVPPDRQEKHDVHHDESHRVDGATGRVLVGYLSLDHQRQEVGEKDHQASLFSSPFTACWKEAGATRLAAGPFVTRGLDITIVRVAVNDTSMGRSTFFCARPAAQEWPMSR